MKVFKTYLSRQQYIDTKDGYSMVPSFNVSQKDAFIFNIADVSDKAI